MMKTVATLLFILPVAKAFSIDDTTVLNFALKLKYLEATFYKCAVYGIPLNLTDIGAGPAAPAVTGCTKAAGLDGTAFYQYAADIAADEIAHVKALRATLGAHAAASPAVDVSPAVFDALFQAAAPTVHDTFSPYTNARTFLIGAFVFEDVGVTAYAGAAPGLSDNTVLSAAAKIMAVEAYHAGAIRNLLLVDKAFAIGTNATDTASAAANAISALRATVSQSAGTVAGDQGITVGAQLTENLVPADANGLAFARTAAQVVAIVTLNGPQGRGGFFPTGLSLVDPVTPMPTPAPTTGSPIATPAPTPKSAASSLQLSWTAFLAVAAFGAKLLI